MDIRNVGFVEEQALSDAALPSRAVNHSWEQPGRVTGDLIFDSLLSSNL
jgi:hypothetical protein